MKSQKKYCDGSTSWNCCFARDTQITVKENNNIVKKSIFEVKKGDLILTLVNGEKIFTNVKYTREYDDEFEFYEFKCMKDGKVKSITVTNNHIMIVYNKNMDEKRYNAPSLTIIKRYATIRAMHVFILNLSPAKSHEDLYR